MVRFRLYGGRNHPTIDTPDKVGVEASMRLVQIARFPVKSLQGELLPRGLIEPSGLAGDRCWGIRDDRTGKILTARREPRLLFAAATLEPGDVPRIVLPGGATCTGPGPETDAVLSAWLERPVQLVRSAEVGAAQAEFFADPTDDDSEALTWTMPAGRFVDAQPLLVLTTASVRAAAALHPAGDWDLRRFRANLVVDVDDDGWLEDTWCGTSVLTIGAGDQAVRLRPIELCVRCTMVTRPQPELGDDRDIFRTLARHHGGLFGAWTGVVRGGAVDVGAQVRVTPFADMSAVVGQQRRREESDVADLL